MNTHKPKLTILIFEQVEVLDFAGPFEVFSVANQLHDYSLFDVITVSHTTKAQSAVNGLKIQADFDFHNCPQDVDYLVIPGGDGTKMWYLDDAYRDWIARRVAGAKHTLTVCSGARFLAAMGMLNGKEYCTHQGVYASIKELAPIAIPRPELRYLTEGNITTAGGISAGIDASFAVLQKMTSQSVADKTAQYMEYHRNDAECGAYWR